MKSSFLVLSFIFGLFFFNTTSAQDALTKENIKVWGNCGMCKERIEKAALEAGASSASWNAKRQSLKVSFDPAKTNSQDIQKAIAAVGHDTQDMTASNEVYDKLHGCCKYERKDGKSVASSASSCCAEGKSCKHQGACAGKDCCKDGKACTDHKACEASGCCKDKSCCAAGKSADCCKDGKACTDHKACAEKGCCAGKTCCKA